LQLALSNDTRQAAAAEAGEAEVSVRSSTSQQQVGKPPATTDMGKDCECGTLTSDLVREVVESMSWPEGLAGELEGVVRLLGGGMMVRL